MTGKSGPHLGNRFFKGTEDRDALDPAAANRTALDEASTRALASIFPGARIDVESLYGEAERVMRGRHKTYEAYQRIILTSVAATKMTMYGDLVRAMLADQLAFLAEPLHVRVLTEVNGRESLRMSVRATELAVASSRRSVVAS